MNTTAAASYDSKVATSYDTDRETEEHWALENGFIQDHFRDGTAQRILDLPVGTGRFLPFYPPTAEVLGVDISKDMLLEASKHISAEAATRIRLSHGDGESLEFLASGSIDSIVCFRLMHLVKNPSRLRILREFAWVMKGELILQAYVSPSRSLAALAARYVDKAIGVLMRPRLPKVLKNTPWSHIKSYRLKERELLEMFGSAGLTVSARYSLCTYEGSEVAVFLLRKVPLISKIL